MSKAESVLKAMRRLGRHDPTLQEIYLFGNRHADAELAELADCLLAHPDVVTSLSLNRNKLTDETGVKLARYLAASTTVEWLGLSSNQFGAATYLALAAALRVNTSLRVLSVFGNKAVDQTLIDTAYIEALRLNPDRPADSVWRLYSFDFSDVDFKRLKDEAEQLGHPSLQLLLALLC